MPPRSDAAVEHADLGACRRRVAELEARLREAEETLGAIRAGDVDALTDALYNILADPERLATLLG